MTNKEIGKAFKLAGQLMELHGDNPFKSRSFQNAAFRLERFPVPIASVSDADLEGIDGIGKGILEKIKELLTRGSFKELDTLLEKTPPGIIEMMQIKGIGPKKISVLWKELGIESTGELLYACHENRLVELRGFGTKSQEQIRQAIEYTRSQEGKFRYAAVETISNQILADFQAAGIAEKLSSCGELRRKNEILTSADWLIAGGEIKSVLKFLEDHPLFEKDSLISTGNSIRGMIAGKLPFEIHCCTTDNFERTLFTLTGSASHLEKIKSLNEKGEIPAGMTEQAIYHTVNLRFIEPELREGLFEFELKERAQTAELLTDSDLKGILHNHTTYSDGANTLEEMAVFCKELGYEYVGICDHSRSAFYANGLQPERVLQQQAEIDTLNDKLAPFRILKGIESDILSDGSLDYPDEILKTFDLVVASVHSGLRMDEAKATSRLIRAIENPFTTLLGHPTGRLLLSRPGYPLDMHKVIDACAANGVVIELNANPYRLDLDWRYIPYAMKKNVMISVNPDAHRREGYYDMHYGVCSARKGGLIAAMTLNALPLARIIEKLGLKK
ncbi:MAG: DNA polymerase/3'-5' exonuclease PolX [Bacteroidia bacterium]|nr:DNA polymerase/3'-5' exonuclease PolX [Bacteroidia bacterium]